ncbi:hypothetical protein KIN20_025984 [Parelaphostrongylus tenuis]|uniref:Uncharacterized protein n=1 Tax=Parelaphostrongylus tenuis TaxID=148309 RepID=A0AAD5QWW6_PARTN|nr:hypothetical protein KIN20_025984 [Parelaphostrongylus tenuis]
MQAKDPNSKDRSDEIVKELRIREELAYATTDVSLEDSTISTKSRRGVFDFEQLEEARQGFLDELSMSQHHDREDN